MNHATDNYRFEFGTFIVVNYGEIDKSTRYATQYAATLNLQHNTFREYECWLTTSIEDLNQVTLLQSAMKAYPLNSTLDVWYNSDGSRCGFTESAAISRGALGMILFFVWIGAVSTPLFIVCWYHCICPSRQTSQVQLSPI